MRIVADTTCILALTLDELLLELDCADATANPIVAIANALEADAETADSLSTDLVKSVKKSIFDTCVKKRVNLMDE